jgi:hypothetical protein
VTAVCDPPRVERLEAASVVAVELAALPGVLAVALGGSEGAGTADAASDLDFYVYSDGPVPLTSRAELAERLAHPGAEVGNDLWEPGDEWTHSESGAAVDAMYRTRAWIEEQLDRVLVRQEASLGYSTCFWHNVRSSRALVDPDGWYAGLQARADCPYPGRLSERIVVRNYRVLRDMHSSYATQMARAAARRDRANLVDRASAFLASYFDIVFAANRLPHPGEKRQLAAVERDCAFVPPRLGEALDDLASALAAPWVEQPSRIRAAVDALVDRLDAMLDSSDAPSVLPAVRGPLH